MRKVANLGPSSLISFFCYLLKMNQCDLLQLFAFHSILHSIRHFTKSKLTDPRGSVKHCNLCLRNGKHFAKSVCIVMAILLSQLLARDRSVSYTDVDSTDCKKMRWSLTQIENYAFEAQKPMIVCHL